MVIDTSALVAIALDEPECDMFIQAILKADRALLSAANWLEVTIVLDRKLPADRQAVLDGLVEDLRITIVPFSSAQAARARTAYRAYGLYSPARALNFGDCFAYALAKETGQKLLFKGNDFSKTDIPSALAA